MLVHSAPDSLFNRSCARRDRMDGRVLLLSGMLPCDDTSRAPARSERGVPDHPFAAQQPCRCFPNDDDVVAPAQVSVGFPSGYFHHRDHTLTFNFAQYAAACHCALVAVSHEGLPTAVTTASDHRTHRAHRQWYKMSVCLLLQLLLLPSAYVIVNDL